MLITTGFLLDRGAKLDIRFALPGQAGEVSVVGQVVWSAAESASRFRSGIQIIVMRGDAGSGFRNFFSRGRRDGLSPAAPAAAPSKSSGRTRIGSANSA